MAEAEHSLTEEQLTRIMQRLLLLWIVPEEVGSSEEDASVTPRRVSRRFFAMLVTVVNACDCGGEDEINALLERADWRKFLLPCITGVFAATNRFVQRVLEKIPAAHPAAVRIQTELQGLKEILRTCCEPDARRFLQAASGFFAQQEEVLRSCQGQEPLLEYEEVKRVLRVDVAGDWQEVLLSCMNRLCHGATGLAGCMDDRVFARFPGALDEIAKEATRKVVAEQ